MCNVRDLRERGKLKIYKLSPVLGSIRTVKNCDLWQHFKDLRLSFSIIRTSQPENKKHFFQGGPFRELTKHPLSFQQNKYLNETT